MGRRNTGAYVFIAAIMFVLQFLVITGTAQQPKVLAPHRKTPPLVPANKRRPLPPSKAGSMVGGIWMTDANFRSELHLRNVVETSAVTVTPVLHLSNGTQYSLSSVQLPPAGNAIVDISSGLQSLGISSYATLSGWVEVQYNWPWNPLCATVHNVDATHSLLFNYDLHTKTQNAKTGPPLANTVEGLWWKQEPNVTGFVALANTSSAPITAILVTKDAQSNAIGQHAVTISPLGMKMVSLSELQGATGTTGGVTITYSGSPGDLNVNGGLEDQSNGYSANIPFAEVSSPPHTTLQVQPDIAELGLMSGAADPMMAFPAGTTFTPYSVVRNTSNSSVTITPTLWWMASGAAQSAAGSPVTIASGQSQGLDISSLLLNAGLKNFSGSFNLVLKVQGSPGSLLMAAGSVDQSYTYVFEVAPHGVVASAAQSLSYWSTANGDDTMVTLWNPADESQDFIFRLYFTGGQYGLPLHLGPRETRTLNISQIIATQVPDAQGNIIPASVTQGSAKLLGSQADNQMILVALDAGTYNVRKATCGEDCHGCDGWVDAWIDTNPFSVDVNRQVQLFFLDQWDTGYENDLTGEANWSGGSNITVNSGLVTGVTGGATGLGAGDSYEPGYVDNACLEGVWYCPLYEGVGASASGNVYDATPSITSINPNNWNAGTQTPLTIYGSGFGTNPQVSISGTGITNVTYTPVNDGQINAAVTIDPTTPDESVTVTVTSTGYNGSGFIGAGGQSNNGSANASVVALAAPAPRIYFNGTDVTGMTQNVVVGEEIQFSTVPNIPSGLAITANNWVIPGNIIGGYQIGTGNSSASVLVPITSNPSATVYWISGSQGLQVQYSYCMNNGQCSPAASATFNVAAPVAPNVTTTLGTWSVDPTTGTMVFVSASFQASVTGPTGFSGGPIWVQLIDSGSVTITSSSGTQTCGPVSGLDNLFPFDTGYSTNDNPQVSVSSGATRVVLADSFTMYLMWQASIPNVNTIQVPLGYVNWSIQGAEDNSSGSWLLESSNSNASASLFKLSSGYPTWTTLVKNGGICQ